MSYKGVQIPTREGAVLRGKGAGPGHDRTYILKATQQGAATVRMPIGCILDGVHIGGSRRIPLNRPCAAAMRPYVRLLRPLV